MYVCVYIYTGRETLFIYRLQYMYGASCRYADTCASVATHVSAYLHVCGGASCRYADTCVATETYIEV